MTPDELAIKLVARIDFMILQHVPAPTCANKQAAHRELVMEVKEKVAGRLIGNNGVNINITV